MTKRRASWRLEGEYSRKFLIIGGAIMCLYGATYLVFPREPSKTNAVSWATWWIYEQFGSSGLAVLWTLVGAGIVYAGLGYSQNK